MNVVKRMKPAFVAVHRSWLNNSQAPEADGPARPNALCRARACGPHMTLGTGMRGERALCEVLAACLIPGRVSGWEVLEKDDGEPACSAVYRCCAIESADGVSCRKPVGEEAQSACAKDRHGGDSQQAKGLSARAGSDGRPTLDSYRL